MQSRLLSSIQKESIFKETRSAPIRTLRDLLTVFALGLTNSEDELNRKSKLICALTRGYVPPEVDAQYVYDDPKTQNMGCHDWTNVWQIARVAEAMMKLTMQPDQIEYRLGKKVEEMEPEILDWEGELPGQDYSMDLRRLLSRCLKFDPTKRPSSRRVLQSITTSPAFLQHRHGMDTFGNDAWFEEQQRKHDQKKAAKPSPKTTPPTPEEVEAATKKRKRLANAEIYTRAWEADKRAKFRELEVLPNEKFDLEYGYNELWSTAQFPLRDENGAFLYDLDHDFLPDGTPYMKGHTASVGIQGLRIATSRTAVGGDAGDEGENDQAGGDNGDDDEDYSRSPSPPFLSIN